MLANLPADEEEEEEESEEKENSKSNKKENNLHEVKEKQNEDPNKHDQVNGASIVDQKSRANKDKHFQSKSRFIKVILVDKRLLLKSW